MATVYNKISTSDGTVLIDLSEDSAKAADVLRGKTFHEADGRKKEGTCPYNADTSSDTVTPETLLAGYTAHNGAGQPIEGTCPYNADTSRDTVTPSDILTGKTAHDADGDPITGTCPYNADTKEDTVTAPDLLAGATAHDAQGRAITGTCPYNSDTKEDTVTAADLAAGKTAHDAAGAKITGTNANNADTRNDTLTPADLAEGKTAHDASGAQITGTNTYNADTRNDSVTAETLKQGETAHDASGALITGTMKKGADFVPEKDVNFYDYDGTRVFSYTLAEVQALTELPEGPTHPDLGLTFTQWNWTLQELKTNATYGAEVGAEFGIPYYVMEATGNFMTFDFTAGLDNNSYGPATIDWGDGSEDIITDTQNDTALTHTYAEPGRYVVRIITDNGLTRKNNAGSYFWGSMRTPCIAIGYTPTLDERYLLGISGEYSYSMKCEYVCISRESGDITVTNGGSGIPTYLGVLSIPGDAVSCPSIGDTAGPDRVKLPDSVITINRGIKALQGIAELDGAYVTSLNDVFYTASRLVKVNLPRCATIKQNAFYSCYRLPEIELPACQTVDTYAFSGCSRLVRADLGQCQSIAARAFVSCSKLSALILRSTEGVCTLASTNALPSGSVLKIYVPDDLVASYKAATNWSTFASKIYGLSELPA